MRLLTETSEQKLETLRATLESKLGAIQQDNNAKLEQMRATVEEKLQTTLERRLGESFRIVSENLQQVHMAMGEMRKLAGEVGSLQTLMSNVKNRGGWGEFQLAAPSSSSFSAPSNTRKTSSRVITARMWNLQSNCRVAMRKARRSGFLSMPNFPRRTTKSLLAAVDRQDAEQIRIFSGQLELRIKANAREISQKYLNPPQTTDFGIMFLPTEGLYAEVLRRPGLADYIQREYRVIIAGPTTLVALLNSLQVGFRTLAIEKRSSEVWKILGAVKAQFSTFGDVLAKVQRKLQQATSEIETVGTKARTMQRKLREVESIAVDASDDVFGFESLEDSSAQPELRENSEESNHKDAA